MWENCWGTQCRPFYGHLIHLKQIGKVKMLDNVGTSWADQKLKKIIVLKCCLLFFSYCAQQRPISWSDCDVWWEVDFIWQPVTTSSVVELRRNSKALPKARLAPKKGHGHYLVVFHPFQLSESWWNHYICKVCSANWWDAPKTAMPAAGFGQQKGPHSSLQQQLTARCTSNTSKVEWISYEVLPHLACSPNLSRTDCHFLKHLDNFCRENASTTSRRQKMLFEFVKSQSRFTDFYAAQKSRLISHW